MEYRGEASQVDGDKSGRLGLVSRGLTDELVTMFKFGARQQSSARLRCQYSSCWQLPIKSNARCRGLYCGSRSLIVASSIFPKPRFLITPTSTSAATTTNPKRASTPTTPRDETNHLSRPPHKKKRKHPRKHRQNVPRGVPDPDGRPAQARRRAAALAPVLHLRRLRPQVVAAPDRALPSVQGVRVPHPIQGADEEVCPLCGGGLGVMLTFLQDGAVRGAIEGQRAR